MFLRSGGFLGAIFDYDGVLVDSIPLHFEAWRKAFEEEGITFTLKDYKEKVDGVPRIEGARAVLPHASVEKLRKICEQKQRYLTELLKRKGVQPFEDTVALIRALKERGIKIAVVSSSRNAASFIRKLGLGELFDTTVLGEPEIRPKPDAEIFLEAARRLGIAPSSCVVFEDAKLGIKAAKRAGMFCVGIHRGFFYPDSEDVLREADIIVQDLCNFSPERIEELVGINRFAYEEDFSSLLSEEEWLVQQDDFHRETQKAWESIFALGNGYLGRRGSLEELPAGSCPGMYIAGLFDKSQAQVPQLVNIPHPFSMRIQIGEIPLNLRNCCAHYRVLDMKQAILVRKIVFNTKRAGRVLYRSELFLSMRDKNVGALRVFVTPLERAVTFTIKSKIDGSVVNYDSTQKRDIRHIEVVDIGESDGICYLICETKEKKIPIAETSHLDVAMLAPEGDSLSHPSIELRETTYRIHANKVSRELKTRVQKDQTLCITQIFYVRHFEQGVSLKSVRQQTLAATKKVIQRGYANLFERHREVWNEFCQAADILLKGDPAAQKAIRFSIYHLFSSAPGNCQASIGARGLTGESYSGHVFWDTEIYAMPFFVYTTPTIAKNLLLYRYARLAPAKEKAREYGFAGAMFPWESADTGEEVTPRWAKGNFGRRVEILTGEQQHHIVSDIAYALFSYWRATGDRVFMER